MHHIMIEGVNPYDGRYEIDFDLTVREWGWVKRHADYLPLTWWDGLAGSDAEVLVVLALIALVRAGKLGQGDFDSAWERFQDAPGLVAVRLELAPREDQAGDADPSASSNGNEPISGAGSLTSSETSVPAPNRSGGHRSDSSPSVPVESVT